MVLFRAPTTPHPPWSSYPLFSPLFYSPTSQPKAQGFTRSVKYEGLDGRKDDEGSVEEWSKIPGITSVGVGVVVGTGVGVLRIVLHPRDTTVSGLDKTTVKPHSPLSRSSTLGRG